jgi:CO dehydrogenase maturation factor
MAYSIAFAGKGGTGKTTMAGMLIRFLVENGRTPVLAVDADSNANLNEVLGLSVAETLGQAREDMKKGGLPGMTKDIFMEMKLQAAVVESNGFDLIVMGRPEGPGCYCAANTLLTQSLDKLLDNYAYVVIDNEAGMEHISRLTTNNIDVLVVVSDPTRRGVQAASRIVELTQDLGLRIRRRVIIVNQAKPGQEQAIRKAASEFGLELSGAVPEDPAVQEFDLSGRPTVELGKGSPALRAAYSIFEKLLSA